MFMDILLIYILYAGNILKIPQNTQKVQEITIINLQNI